LTDSLLPAVKFLVRKSSRGAAERDIPARIQKVKIGPALCAPPAWAQQLAVASEVFVCGRRTQSQSKLPVHFNITRHAKKQKRPARGRVYESLIGNS